MKKDTNRIFILANGKVNRVIDPASPEQIALFKKDIHEFLKSSVLASERESIEAAIWVDNCDHCHNPYTVFDWSWWKTGDSTKQRESTLKILQSYNAGIKETEWSSGESLADETIRNFCEDCYCNFADDELGIRHIEA